ncbi:MAG: hypothetical protein IT168_04410 [Bryobacterales bacterium]|nr:hypothetical protein [Bryobacterales bacterium]
MSFLDNLENNLKALERAEEADPEQQKRLREARAAERDLAQKLAPLAEALKSGPFTDELLRACRTIGHRMRTMVRVTWIDSTLRLEAREKRLELSPAAEGVVAKYFKDGAEERQESVDLQGNASEFAERWLAG